METLESTHISALVQRLEQRDSKWLLNALRQRWAIVNESERAAFFKNDRLSALPNEIIYQLLSYLLIPARKGASSFGCEPHPFNQLALISHFWEAQIDYFCRRQLKIMQLDAKEWVEHRHLLVFASNVRMELIFRLREYCVFCGKQQLRVAKAEPHPTCCEQCEKHWACERRAFRDKSPACNCKGDNEYLAGQSDDEFDLVTFRQRELECIERNYHWRRVRADGKGRHYFES